MAAAESYERFAAYDFAGNEAWQEYLGGLYPQPNHRQVVKFKKKWYKRNVDPDLDDTYDPNPPPPPMDQPEPATTGSGKGISPTASVLCDGAAWQVMLGRKTVVCMVAYATALFFAAGSFALVFPPWNALCLLTAAMVVGLLAKHSLKRGPDSLQNLLIDDVGVMPVMAITLLMPGIHWGVRVVALVPFTLTAVLELAQICHNHAGLPEKVRDFAAPLAGPAARWRVMEVRGHAEVAVGMVLLGSVFAGVSAPFGCLLFWNFMMVRYMMSCWTQASFRRIDRMLAPACDKVPGVKQGYASLRRFLYSFVDPGSKKAGSMCTIL